MYMPSPPPVKPGSITASTRRPSDSASVEIAKKMPRRRPVITASSAPTAAPTIIAGTSEIAMGKPSLLAVRIAA